MMMMMWSHVLLLILVLNTICHHHAMRLNQHTFYTSNNDHNDDILKCPKLKQRNNPPRSVYDLRIDDFKVIAALGDSITAGLLAKPQEDYVISQINQFNQLSEDDTPPETLPEIPERIFEFYENRGVSFSMGGDENATTLPNFMKHYRSDLIGASIGDHIVEICGSFFCPPFQYRKNDVLNAAQSGARFGNLVHETKYLLRMMKDHPDIDMENDWKLLTLFIGSNDLCHSCKDIINPFPSTQKLNRSLHSVISKLPPRTVLNIIGLFNVSQVYDFQDVCNARFMSFKCFCAFKGPTFRKWMDDATVEYNRLFREFVEWASRDPDLIDRQIGLVYDSGLTNVDFRVVEDPDKRASFISKVDCFHPSMVAHRHMAVTLWNNLFQREKESMDLIHPHSVYCPNENDRIAVVR